MSVLFLADFYSDQINGGGETNDAVLIDYLRSQEIEIVLGQTQHITPADLDAQDTIIVSNFVLLSPSNKQHLVNNCDYIIYEHDHKYVKTRDPSKFSNFDITPNALVNVELYQKARAVVVLSQICKDIMEKNLGNTNVHSIGSSLWSKAKIEFLRTCNKEKTKEYAVVDSSNPTKGRQSAIEFCRRKGIEFDLIASDDQYEFLGLLTQYKTLIFVPQVLETFCRLVAEAKMLECNVYTNKTLIGMMSEPYGELSGNALIDVLEGKVSEALTYFYGLVAA